MLRTVGCVQLQKYFVSAMREEKCNRSVREQPLEESKGLTAVSLRATQAGFFQYSVASSRENTPSDLDRSRFNEDTPSLRDNAPLSILLNGGIEGALSIHALESMSRAKFF